MKEVQAILREIVKDQQENSMRLDVLSMLVQKLDPKTMHELNDKLTQARQARQQFYDNLQKQIEALA